MLRYFTSGAVSSALSPAKLPSGKIITYRQSPVSRLFPGANFSMMKIAAPKTSPSEVTVKLSLAMIDLRARSKTHKVF